MYGYYTTIGGHCWAHSWVLVCFVGVIAGQFSTDSVLSSVTLRPQTICEWARCRKLCGPSVDQTVIICEDLLPNNYEILKCSLLSGVGLPEKVCVGPSSNQPTKRRNCKQSITSGTICFRQYFNTTTTRNHTEICLDSNSPCQELYDFCYDRGYYNCSLSGPPSTLLPTPSTVMKTNGILNIPGGNDPMTTGTQPTDGDVRSSPTIPVNSVSEFLQSTFFFIGIAVGSSVVTLLLAGIIFLYITRKKRRKGSHKLRRGRYEMNNTPVYQEMGPALPPNHPSTKKSGHTTIDESYQGVVATPDTAGDQINILQHSTVPPSTAHGSQVSTPNTQGRSVVSVKYQKAKKRTNSHAMVNKDPQSSERLFMHSRQNSHDSGTSSMDLSPGPVYIPLKREELTKPDYGDQSQDTSYAHDRAYMTLEPTNVDHPAISQETEVERVEHHSCSNQRKVHNSSEPSHYSVEVHRPVAEVKVNIGSDTTESSESKLSDVVQQKSKQNQPNKQTNSEEVTDNLPDKYEQHSDVRRVTTFPRQKKHSSNESRKENGGSETPSKFKFRSLKLGSKRKALKSKKNKIDMESKLCLDVKITSPPSTEDTGHSLFTSSVPIGNITPDPSLLAPTNLETPQTLSKSQEALFHDAAEDPFRSRSCSQPTCKTFSPTLCKEYEEIRESWGATYLQNFKME